MNSSSPMACSSLTSSYSHAAKKFTGFGRIISSAMKWTHLLVIPATNLLLQSLLTYSFQGLFFFHAQNTLKFSMVLPPASFFHHTTSLIDFKVPRSAAHSLALCIDTHNLLEFLWGDQRCHLISFLLCPSMVVNQT
jgi:hypothetical protein